MRRQRSRFVLLGVVILAAALRAWRLEERGLWFDEAFSWRLTRFGWAEMLYRATLDNNPPLYYACLKLWAMILGSSAFALRLLSVLSGTAACAAMYLFVDEMERGLPARRGSGHSHWTALFASALLATSVFQARWSWEARMYALGAALAALSSWLLVRALNAGPQARGAWLVYAIVSLGFMYTHTFALLSIAAQVVYVISYFASPERYRALGRVLRRGLSGPVLAATVIAVGFAPWLPVLARQCEQVHGKFWIGRFNRMSVPSACYQMFVEPDESRFETHEAWICTLAGFMALVALIWGAGRGDWLVLLSASTPVILGAAIAATGTPVFYPRYLIFAHLFLLAALARVIGRMPGALERTIIAGAALATFLSITCDFRDCLTTRASPGLRGAAEHIRANARAGESVIVCSVYHYLPLLFHLGDEVHCRLLDPERPILHYEGAAVIEESEMISLANATVTDAERLWVVEGGAHSRAIGLPGARWHVAERRSFHENYVINSDIAVVAYERKLRR